MNFIFIFLFIHSLIAQSTNSSNNSTIARIILPPGTPKGAFDSLAYSQLLTRFAPCPGYENNTDCSYIQTPLTGPVQWTCVKGNYCVGPGNSNPCSPGFYCPQNAAQPVYCPEGFYCAADTFNITICPANYYCPRGSTKALSCNFLAYCPIGSSSAPKYGIFILLVLWILIPIFLFKWKSASDHVRMLKHKYQIETLNNVSSLSLIEKPQLAKLEKTFDITFKNLGLTLTSGITIMKGVSGKLLSGRTTAIMGPSGAGKTTFVTLLTGKVKRTHGTVEINGNPDELSNYKKLIGYVPQEDIMIRELTVREILMHSARMRLPSDWDYKRIKTKVLEIIKFLGMSHVMDSIIGNEEERGVSGGQRKRVNIGMELVAEPSILFLDEPTSGLDSSTSFEVCSNLKSIAQQQGLTVAAVIHSPSPATFKQFDDFLLLGKGGRVVYMGPREHAVTYFSSIGFPCPDSESPSDFFMDVVTGKVKNIYDPDFVLTSLFDYWDRTMAGKPAILRKNNELSKDIDKKESDVIIMNSNTSKAQKHMSLFTGMRLAFMSFFKDIIDYVIDVGSDFFVYLKSVFSALLCFPDPVRSTCPFYIQLWLLMKRAFRQVFRDASTFIFDCLLHFGCGIFISVAIQNFNYLGSFPWQICSSQARDLSWICYNPTDNITTAAMFVSLGVLFAGISASMTTFGKERVVFWRDSASGMSSVPYYIAKFIIDIPRVALAGLMYAGALTLFYSMQGSFSSIVLIVELLYFSAFGIGYFISIVFSAQQAPLLGTGFALLWALVLSGVVPTLDDVYSEPLLKSLSFLWDISAPRWAIEAFWLQEVGATSFADKKSAAPHHYDWNNLNLDIRNIVILGLAWNLIAFFSLRLFNRDKLK